MADEQTFTKCCLGCDPSCDGPSTCADRAWAEVERLRAERDDHKQRLAVEAVTAPDADYDTMMDSLQARLRDLHAEVERLRAGIDKLAEQDYKRYWNIQRLRVAGDALAQARHRDLGRSTLDDPLLDAWQEASRG